MYIQAFRPVGPEKLRIDWSGFYKDVRQKTPKLCITGEFKISVVETVLFLVVFRGSDFQKHSPTRAKIVFRKVPCKSSFPQVGIQYSYDELYMCITGSAAEMQAPAHSNLMDPGITFPLSV